MSSANVLYIILLSRACLGICIGQVGYIVSVQDGFVERKHVQGVAREFVLDRSGIS